MADPQDVERIRAYLKQYCASFSQDALRARLIKDGHPNDAIELAFAQEFGPQSPSVPSSSLADASEPSTPPVAQSHNDVVTPADYAETTGPVPIDSASPPAQALNSVNVASGDPASVVSPDAVPVAGPIPSAATPTEPRVGYVVTGTPPVAQAQAQNGGCVRIGVTAFCVLLVNFVAVPLLIGFFSQYVNLNTLDDLVVGSLILVAITIILEIVGTVITWRNDPGISRGLLLGMGLTAIPLILIVAIIGLTV